jgi:hypothetical protein
MDYELFMGKANREKAFQTLIGILEGIHIDKEVNIAEMGELYNWRNEHDFYRNVSPFNEILEIIDDAFEDGILTVEEVNDIQFVCKAYEPDSRYYDLITASIQELHGLLQGILCDSKISALELSGLKHWLDDNSELEGTFPYDEVYSIIQKVLEDGIVDSEEEKMLKVLFSDFIDLDETYCIDKEIIAELKKELKISGLCAFAPDVLVKDNIFCFTGESEIMTRNEIAKTIESNGGYFKNSVSQKINYLVVGAEANSCWAFSCYGRKIEKAMELRKKGVPIVIIHEIDFWDAIVS